MKAAASKDPRKGAHDKTVLRITEPGSPSSSSSTSQPTDAGVQPAAADAQLAQGVAQPAASYFKLYRYVNHAYSYCTNPQTPPCMKEGRMIHPATACAGANFTPCRGADALDWLLVGLGLLGGLGNGGADCICCLVQLYEAACRVRSCCQCIGLTLVAASTWDSCPSDG